MGAISAAVKHMLAAGMKSDEIVAAIEEMESAPAARTARQERNARYYQRKASEKRLKSSYSSKSDVSDGKRLNPDASPDPAHVEDNPSNLEGSGKEEKKVLFVAEAKKPAKATRLPADFVPDMQVASDIGLTPSKASFEAAKFLDYWRAKSGKDATKQDWPATWRNWCRKALESTPPQRPNGHSPPQKQMSVGEMFRDDARKKGLLDDKLAEPLSGRMEAGNGNGHGDCFGKLIEATVASGWPIRERS